jgi:6-pyruvoyltetrahydropterin/6-carboxytetrahydropterin synthase
MPMTDLIRWLRSSTTIDSGWIADNLSNRTDATIIRIRSGQPRRIAPTKRAYSEQNTIDRTFLNKEISCFEEVVPTAENIAVRIGQLWRSPVGELAAELHKIKLIESPNNSWKNYGADLEEVAAQSQQPEAVLAGV